jgi:hypothetical protein
LGDGTLGYQANPGGGFGMPGNMQQMTGEAAYRVHSGAAADPCESALPATCAADVDGDGYVAVSDVLAIIGSWGLCGDGTFRPTGDIAPMPNGDCCVNVADVLAVVGSWGADCAIYGGCCLGDGSCSEETLANCDANGGVYFGDDTTCADGDCSTAACCLSDMSCQDLTSAGCTALGGTLHAGDDCSTWDCSVATPGDECVDAVAAVDGANPYDTTGMTPSQPQPDDAMCSASALAWDNSQDFWFVWTASVDDVYNIRTCENGYDTSMVIYEGSCTNQIACNGDFGDGTGNNGECTAWYSQIDLNATAGTTYYIRMGGWQGTAGAGTLNINVELPPVPGACCLPGEVCLDNLDSDSCATFGGVFAGEGTTCDDDPSPCGSSGGFADECADAGLAMLGANPFDTSLMTPSTPEPDETQCEGTFLDWTGSSDGWFSFVAGSTASHNFNTCDAAGYDTSMVLYEGTCDNQVACNGDGSGSDGCQAYYSELDFACTAGNTYYIRLGGWQGDVGSATLNISVDDPNATAACCDAGACLGDMTNAACDTAGGTWVEGESCATYACPQPACPGAQVSQNVHGVDDGWSAGTSTMDTGVADYMRAESVNLASMSDVSVWGLQLYYSGSWASCSNDYGFNVRAYDDAGGMPGAVSSEALDAPAVKTATGMLYAGLYEGFRFDMDFAATNVGWIGLQSASDGLNCWFLWMSSGIGDGSSALSTDGGAWDMSYAYDLALCIN